MQLPQVFPIKTDDPNDEWPHLADFCKRWPHPAMGVPSNILTPEHNEFAETFFGDTLEGLVATGGLRPVEMYCLITATDPADAEDARLDEVLQVILKFVGA